MNEPRNQYSTKETDYQKTRLVTGSIFAALVLGALCVGGCVTAAPEDDTVATTSTSDALSEVTNCWAVFTNMTGNVCGGSWHTITPTDIEKTHACTPGSLYTCTADPNGLNNSTCVLKTQCSFGCRTQPMKDIQGPPGNPDETLESDTCLPAPGAMALSSTSVIGGGTVQAIVNVPANTGCGIDLAADIAAYSFQGNVPSTVVSVKSDTLLLPVNAPAKTVHLPVKTSAVSSTTSAQIWTVSHSCPGKTQFVDEVSTLQTLTVNP